MEQESILPIVNNVVLVASCLTIPLLALLVWSLVWAYRDAERRGQNGALVTILVAVAAWPLGLVVWLLVRGPVDGAGGVR